MKVERIYYVSILVKDIQEAGKFFSDLFGIEFSSPTEFTNYDAWVMRSQPFQPFGIELQSPRTPDGPTARTLARRGEGLSLLSLKVANIEEAVAEMNSKGIRQIMPFGGGRTAMFHPRDLYGVILELTGGG